MARPPQTVILRTALLLGIVSLGCLPSPKEEPPPPAPGNQGADVQTSPEPKQPIPAVKGPVDPLRQRVEAALARVHSRQLLTTNSFWTIFHGILGMGPSTTLKDPNTGTLHNALDYLFSENGSNISGLLFTPTDVGLDVVTVGRGFGVKEHEGQGHQDQFLAEMIQWGVPADKPVKVRGTAKTYRLQDFVTESKARCRVDADQELSWCLIVVAEYGGGTEAEWTNRFGQKLKFDQILDYELKADVNVASCGGTHRLFGVAWAYHRHMALCKKQNRKPTEIWKRTWDYLEKYKNLSREWQGPDGQFSSAHYRERAYAPDLEPRLAASGHILEWLTQHVTDDEIRSSWMENGARAVAQTILDADNVPVASGSLYHAAHGLATYHARRYPKAESSIAKAPK